MFMKTGRKFLGPDLFSPGAGTRLALMSIMSSIIPLALSVSAQALAAPAPVAVTPLPVAITAPAPAVTPAPAPVLVAPPKAAAPKPVPAIARPGGRFTQVDPSGSPSNGEFYISRPGKVRFEYSTPEPIFIVSDGTTVSIEEPKRKSYDAVPLSSTPLHLFLRSNIDLKKDGSVTDVQTSNGSHYVTLVDKTGEAEGKMILQFRQSDFELMGWRQVDGAGAETRVQLSNIQKNLSLKPSLFVVKDPSDAGDTRRN
jgi:outer membrane lipoprotein-sorting protein